MSLTTINLATPKAGARHELLFNKPPSLVQCFKSVLSSGCTGKDKCLVNFLLKFVFGFYRNV
jgi:hypothetical protein